MLWDGVSFLEMTVPPKYRNSLCGLCGNFNGDKEDDFYGRDGLTQYRQSQQFGDAWRVGGMKACSILPRDMPHSYEPECTQTWASRIKSDKFCNAFKSSLFAGCVDKVDPDYYFKACKLDMCECPGEQCHCEVLTAYARECERAGQLISGWRDATNCKNVTSFRYGAKKFPPKTQISNKENDVLSVKKTTTTTPSPSTSSPTTTTTTTTTKAPSLPSWLLTSVASKSKSLGHYLPGCTRTNARHCLQNDEKSSRRSSPSFSSRRRKGHRHQKKYSGYRDARRREREKRKRRKQRRRERKRLRRLRRLRHEQQLRHRKGRRQQKSKKNSHHYRNNNNPSLTSPRPFEANLGEFSVRRVIDSTSGGGRQKLSWSTSSLSSGKKRPPFEALLSGSLPEVNRTVTSGSGQEGDVVQDAGEEYEYEDTMSFFEAADKFRPPQRPRNGRKRVPLPLKEAEYLGGRGNDDKIAGGSDNQRKSWKRRRRREEEGLIFDYDYYY